MSAEDASEVSEAGTTGGVEKPHPLPMWLRKALPEPLPITVLSWVNGKLHFSHNGAEFNDYESADEYANLLYDYYELALDDSLEGHNGHFTDDSHEAFQVESPDEDGEMLPYMMLFARSIETSAATLVKAYKTWMSVTVPSYDSNPDDFFSAHKFVSQHPIFWTLPNGEQAAYSWRTWGGLDNQRVEIIPAATNDEPYMFDITIDGQHKRGDNYGTRMTHPYHCGKGSTYEEAIIALAKNVREVCPLDGTPRVSY